MQNKYVADIGDWGKYGLLRALAPTGTPLSVIWYLVDDEPGMDGRHIDYLGKPKVYEAVDPELFSKLRMLVQNRTVAAVQASGILPADTQFFADRIALDDICALSPMGRGLRLARRNAWFALARATAQHQGVAFLDPDNGFEISSVGPLEKRGPKFVAWEEAREFCRGSATLVAYHHLNRTKKGFGHEAQIQAMAVRLREMSPGRLVVGLRFTAYQSRAYMIVVPSGDPAGVLPRLDAFLDSGWRRFFARVV